MTQWIIPCNINLYDVKGAFEKFKCIDWKQSNRSIQVGDDVFIYVGKPVSAIMYRCKAIRVNYENTVVDDAEFVINGESYENYGNYMELQLEEVYEPSRFSTSVLVENGLKGRIQGPRRVNELGKILNGNKFIK